MKLFLLILLIGSSLAIDQPCEQQKECPSNAQCLTTTGRCVCNAGFIGNCNTSALPLTTTPISDNLTQGQTLLFYINPIQLNVFIEFLFTICIGGQQNVSVSLTIWGETGDNSVYVPSNSLVRPTAAVLLPGCQQFIAPYTALGRQGNGQNELLILGITDNSQGTVVLTASVSQQIVSGFHVYYYILISMVVVVVIVVVIGVGVILLRRRRTGGYQTQTLPAVRRPFANNLEYFQQFMPAFAADHLGPEQQICSICLQNMEFSQTVRRTPCRHIFHASCIDSWCIQNLSCPVCRTDFCQENIEQTIRNLSNGSNNNASELAQGVEIREESIQMAEVAGKAKAEVDAVQTPRIFDFEGSWQEQVEKKRIQNMELDQLDIRIDQPEYGIREHML